MNSTITAPEPGIYHGVPGAEYHAWPLPSNSLLRHLARSPLHCRHAMDHPLVPTPEMEFGTAFHTVVLEPATFGERYVVAPNCATVKADGGRCGNPAKVHAAGDRWLCGVHAKGMLPTLDEPEGPTILSRDDAAKLRAMQDAMIEHVWAAETLSLAGHTELSVVFDDPATGVRCKMRADRVVTHPKRRCVVDVKTTRDAGEAEFARTVHARGYHRQAAMYLRGLAAVGVDVGGFVILAVDKESPYAVAAYRLDDETIEAGGRELDRLLAVWAECKATDRWPGYGDGRLIHLALPAWARRQAEAGTI